MGSSRNRASTSNGENRPQRNGGERAGIEVLESRMLLTTVVVNTTADIMYPAGSTTVSLRNAIATADASTSPTTISFSTSVFATAKTITMNGTEFELSNKTQPVTIVGPASGVTLDAGLKSSVLTIDSGEKATISNVIATRGKNTAIINNGTLLLTSSTISNSVGSPAAGGLQNAGTATLINCTISGNKADFGGGVSDGGKLTLTDDTFYGNTATGSSTYGPNGAAIYVAGSATLVNVTATKNSGGGGNGVYVFTNGTAIVSDSTIVANTGGYGILNKGAQKQFTISNSIVTGNSTSGDAKGPFTSLGYNIIGVNATTATGWTTHDLVGTTAAPINPKLGALANNGGPTQTMLPLSGSPALGAGSIALIPSGTTTDQRGLPRTSGGKVDIGAVEIQSTLSTASIAGEIYNDGNADGKLDGGEFGLASWTVDLYLGTTLVKTATSDIQGDFSFSALTAGNYTVKVVQVAGTQPTKPSGGTLTLTLTTGQASTGNLFGEEAVR